MSFGGLFAQRFEIERFYLDNKDVSATVDPVKDVSGRVCALIKVRSNLSNLLFDSNAGIAKLVYQTGEVLLYVQSGERSLKFMKEGFVTKNFDMDPIPQSGKVYILELVATDIPLQALPVTIRITPPDAKLTINGNEVPNTTTHQLAVGENTIRIEKTDYQTIEKTIKVNEQQVYFEFKLERIKDVLLEISSEPIAATAYLNGVLLGETPVAVFYKPGSYTLRLIKEGYVSIENEPLQVQLPNTRKTYKLEENVGYLTIYTHDGATVSINGKVITDPRNLKMPPQVLKITVSMPKAESIEQQVVLNRNDKLNLDLFPKQQTATLQLAVVPFDADVLLTGDAGERFTTKGSKVLEEIPIGTYTIKVTAQGYQTKQESLTLITGERQSKSIRLIETQVAKPATEQKASNTAANMNFRTVYNPKTRKTWMDRNLGASRVAQSSTDTQAYGDLYQWGRGTDGHEKRTSGTTSTLSSSNTPGHGNFILSPNNPYDWRSPQNNNLWQGVNGTNNPCPPGYRLPTEAEWEAERQSWSSNNASGAFNSRLKLPVAGVRLRSSGSLYNVDSYGYYWSASVDSAHARGLTFGSRNAFMYGLDRAAGRSVRCLKD